ncbi:MAG TPA: holo-ACP synthase [Solirubrobacteraceae bacterium]|nr:holo-ACP synthase [Solirubrobacteraceae bacterium]
MAISVGIDLVEIDEVRESLRLQGERYLKRIYTEAEQRDCGRNPRCLAARFAAKEATMKALRIAGEAVAWRSIEVAHDGTGRPSISLTGEAAELAKKRRILSLDLSLTLNRSSATAVVVAELDAGVSQPPGSGPAAA